MFTHNKIYTDLSGQELVLRLDIDTKTDKIFSIKFDGLLRNAHLKRILWLEDKILNIPIENLPLVLEDINGLPDIASVLLIEFISEYFGIYKSSERRDYICSCFGFTQSEFSQIFNKSTRIEFSELSKFTKATLGCGSCATKLKNEYCIMANRLYKPHQSKECFDETGKWISFKDLTYGQIIIMADKIKNEWLESKQLSNDSITFTSSSGLNIYFESSLDIKEDLALTLEQLVFNRLGLLIFFHLNF